MKAQLRSEFRKLLSTRTFLWLLVGAVGLSVMAVLSVSGQPASETARPFHEQQFMFLSTFVKMFVIVLGIRIVTDEFRYGTVMPTLTFSPRRGRVLAAKAIAGGAAGLVVGVLAQATLLGVALGMFNLQGQELRVGSDAVRALAGGVVAASLWTVIGVGVGAIVRSQVAAIVGSFLWLMALEEILRTKLGDLGGYLPGQAGFALALGGTEVRYSVTGGLTLASYAALTIVIGLVVFRRRDVSS